MRAPTVRRANAADRDVIAEFNLAMARETEGKDLDPEALRRGVERALADSERGRYYVAEDAGRVVGCLLVTREWSDWRDGWYWWIQSVYVVPEHRGRGAYRALHESVRAAANASDDRVVGLRLYVERDNTRAQAVYRRLGMSDSGYRIFEESL